MFGLKKKEERRIDLREILRGCQPGRLQSVGLMQVIPLVSDMTDERYISPVQCDADIYTTSYGTIGFRNTSESVMIVPCHAGYVVKQRAQDHAMTHTGLVASSEDRAFDTAACIQASQGGFIQKGSYRMLILPHSLRHQALAKRKEKNYQKLWSDISSFNVRLGAPGHGHLEYFLKAYQKELDQFVAEFECVPRQVGALILVNQRVVGVERTPSYEYWLSVWPSLIRECYGSLAIEAAKVCGDQLPSRTGEREFPDSIESLEDLERLLAELDQQESEQARALVRELLDEELTLTAEETVGVASVMTATSGHFGGQLVRDGQKVVYASLSATDAFVEAQQWTRAEPFAI